MRTLPTPYQTMRNEDETLFCCRVCSGSERSRIYEAREMMFGLRTQFRYAQCAECGSLSLTDPPTDYTVYYSRYYYSLTEAHGGAREVVKGFLQARRDAAYFGNTGWLARFLAEHFEDGSLLAVSKLQLARDARILDAGCGSGKLLHRMSTFGFTNLSGVDPFLSDNMTNRNGVSIRRAYLEDVAGAEYDLVMFHHSLEHIADPRRTLQAAERLLSPSGKCLVRVPVMGEAWELYGTNWYGLDPPRHMWIPTEKAMTLLAEAVGLKVEKVEYDSTAIQFWGSELWEKDVPLMRVGLNLRARLLIGKMENFRRRARALNLAGRGDIAKFLLSRR